MEAIAGSGLQGLGIYRYYAVTQHVCRPHDLIHRVRVTMCRTDGGVALGAGWRKTSGDRHNGQETKPVAWLGGDQLPQIDS